MSTKSKNIALYKSRIDLWYFTALGVAWMILLFLVPESKYGTSHKVIAFFFIPTFILLGCRFRFDIRSITRFYVFKDFGRKVAYDKIHAIEFRDRSALFERPTIIIHYREKTVKRNWYPFRFFFVSRSDAEKVKAIAESKGVKWIVNN